MTSKKLQTLAARQEACRERQIERKGRQKLTEQRKEIAANKRKELDAQLAEINAIRASHGLPPTTVTRSKDGICVRCGEPQSVRCDLRKFCWFCANGKQNDYDQAALDEMDRKIEEKEIAFDYQTYTTPVQSSLYGAVTYLTR